MLLNVAAQASRVFGNVFHSSSRGAQPFSTFPSQWGCTAFLECLSRRGNRNADLVSLIKTSETWLPMHGESAKGTVKTLIVFGPQPCSIRAQGTLAPFGRFGVGCDHQDSMCFCVEPCTGKLAACVLAVRHTCCIQLHGLPPSVHRPQQVQAGVQPEACRPRAIIQHACRSAPYLGLTARAPDNQHNGSPLQKHRHDVPSRFCWGVFVWHKDAGADISQHFHELRMQ